MNIYYKEKQRGCPLLNANTHTHIFIFNTCVYVYLHQAQDNLFIYFYDSTTLLLSAKQKLFNEYLIIYNISIIQKAITNRPALGVFPGVDWVDRLKRVLISVSKYYFKSINIIQPFKQINV